MKCPLPRAIIRSFYEFESNSFMNWFQTVIIKLLKLNFWTTLFKFFKIALESLEINIG